MSPSIKFELSPAESLIEQFEGSSPNESYPSLFDGMNPSEIDGSEYDYADYERFETQTDNDSVTAATNGGDQTQPEKKVVKKRKSWGQQLPEPKTNLPPRKRAKTEDEKEQRRVERVLRNRRAAQSSRERKRQEVEALESEKVAIERRNRDLELRLAEAEARNLALEQQLLRLSSTSPYLSSPSQKAVDASSSPQVTFSQPLFPSGDSAQFSNQQPRTVNPASLSPSIRPVSSTGAESSNARAPDSSLFDEILPVADSFALDLAHLDPSQAHHSLASLHNNNGNNADMFPDFHLDDFLVAHHDAFDNSPSFFPEECAPATTAGLQPPFGASTDGCDDGRNAVTV
ncbi:transcription factor that binds to CRE motif [Pseudogymnoascus australis]